MSLETPVKLAAAFPTTQWSVVLDAAATNPARASAALEKLCGRYWYPIYGFVRQRGNDVHAAQDLTQGFFAFVLQRGALNRVDRDKGRFRSFLLGSLKNFLLNEYDRSRTLKRGGGHKFISLDENTAEEMLRHETVDHATPEKYFERRWAVTLVRRVLQGLQAEYEQRGQAALFAGLRPALTGELDDGAHDQLATQLGTTPGAVKVSLHRARRRFGELLRREVAHTVSRPEDVEEELRHLLGMIAE